MTKVTCDEPEEALAQRARQAWQRAVEAKSKVAGVERLDSVGAEGLKISALASGELLDPRWASLLRRHPGRFPFLRGTRSASGADGQAASLQLRTESDPQILERALIEDAERGMQGAWIRRDSTGLSGGLTGGRQQSPARSWTGDGAELADAASVQSLAARVAKAVENPGRWVVETGPLEASAWAEEIRSTRDTRAGIDIEFAVDPFAAVLRKGQVEGDMDSQLSALRAVLAEPSARAAGFCLAIGAAELNDASATAVDELALSLAATAEAARALCSNGGDLETACSGMWLTLAVGGELFMDIAKLRVARVLQACLLEACGVRNVQVRVYARSSLRQLSLDDPWTNLLRTTHGAYAAIVGGADAHGVVAHSGVARGGEHDARARTHARLAANLHHILQGEARLGEVRDPGGGSHHLEQLSSSLAREAWQSFQAIEAAGGFSSGLRSGRIQTLLGTRRQARADELDRGTRVAIGINRRALAGDPPGRAEACFAGMDAPDPDRGQNGGKRREGKALRGRDQATSLQVRALSRTRWAVDFEGLRARSRAFAQRHGHPPRALLVTDELDARRRPCLDWAADRCRVAGIEVAGEADAKLQALVDCELVLLCLDAAGEDPVPAVQSLAAAIPRADDGPPLIWISAKPVADHCDSQFVEGGVLAPGRPYVATMASVLARVSARAKESSSR